MHSSSYLLDSPREDVGLSDDMLCHHVHWVRIDPRCSYFRCEHNGQCRYWFATKGELNITLQVWWSSMCCSPPSTESVLVSALGSGFWHRLLVLWVAV